MSWLDAFLEAYNTIQGNGSAVPQRQTLNFTNATVADDATNQRTNVTVTALTTPSGTGFVHVTGGVVDGAASNVNLGTQVTGTLALASLTHGTAGQILATNSGATAPAWVSTSGDIQASTANPGRFWVTSISGANGSGPVTASGKLTAPQFLASTSAGIDRSSAGQLNIGPANATSIVIGGAASTIELDANTINIFAANDLHLGDDSAITVGIGSSSATTAIDLECKASGLITLNPGSGGSIHAASLTVSAARLDVTSAGALSVGTATATGVTIGQTGVNTTMPGAAIVGTTPSHSGTLRMAKQGQANWRNVGDTADLNVLQTDASDHVVVGDSSNVLGVDLICKTGNSITLQPTGTKKFEANNTGIAFFAGSPAAKQAITGALSSVTDANAKAVLTSIIAALTNYTLTTNSTT